MKKTQRYAEGTRRIVKISKRGGLSEACVASTKSDSQYKRAVGGIVNISAHKGRKQMTRTGETHNQGHVHSTHIAQETPTANQKQTLTSHQIPQLVAHVTMGAPANLNLGNSARPSA